MFEPNFLENAFQHTSLKTIIRWHRGVLVNSYPRTADLFRLGAKVEVVVLVHGETPSGPNNAEEFCSCDFRFGRMDKSFHCVCTIEAIVRESVEMMVVPLRNLDFSF